MATVAVIQLKSGADLQENVERALYWIGRAAERGALLAALPENCLCMAPPGKENEVCIALDGIEIETFRQAANQYNMEILLGSIPEAVPGDVQQDGKIYNTSLLIYPISPGKQRAPTAAVYRKIHLFDAILPTGQSYCESAAILPGDSPVVAHSRLGRIGMSICYDLRFPELYRRLVHQGAEILAVPAAFTAETGKVHWFPLLKARAIENLAYVIAPAQSGWHHSQRQTFGHSLILDPWGEVLAKLDADEEGILFADVHRDYLHHLRRRFPVLEHRKLFTSGQGIH